jgi:hypothetical protein
LCVKQLINTSICYELKSVVVLHFLQNQSLYLLVTQMT